VSVDVESKSSRVYCRCLKIVKLEDNALGSKTELLFVAIQHRTCDRWRRNPLSFNKSKVS